MTNTHAQHEPLTATLARNITIAVAAGAVASRPLGVSRWPLLTIVMLWPSLGGHYLELAYLDWVRPRLPNRRTIHVAARIVVWLLGGAVFALAMRWTAQTLIHERAFGWLVWWIGALAFVGVEFIAHAGLYARGRPSVFGDRLPAS